MSNKELVIDVLRHMPDDVTLDDIREEIAILAAIARGEKAAEEGRVLSQEEAMKRSASWLSK